jgi:uncharacterized membrane protein YciS (DUF1049 family)
LAFSFIEQNDLLLCVVVVVVVVVDVDDDDDDDDDVVFIYLVIHSFLFLSFPHRCLLLIMRSEMAFQSLSVTTAVQHWHN